MASQRLIPFMIAGGVGVAGGLYIWQQPMQELSGHGSASSSGEIKDGRSQTVKDSNGSHSPEKHGGSMINDLSKPNIAGSSGSARQSNSIDHDVKTAKPNTDGSNGGGVGVAEMRERKMQGQGLPSPQGGDTKPQAVEARHADGEGGGIKKQKSWWLGGW